MPLSYLLRARTTLHQVVGQLEAITEQQKHQVLEELYLRPPRNPSWGDLCTNLYILLKSKEYISEEELESALLSRLRGLEYIEKVNLAENGYINLRYSPNLWQDNLKDIINLGKNFGLETESQPKLPISIVDPAEIIDLESARQKANAHGLRALASLTGWDIDVSIEPERPPVGYPLDTAYAKCTESLARFALIANPPAFVEAFSPILAIDKSYDNPVFCIPYARWYLRKLVNSAVPVDEPATDMSALSLPIELKLAKLLSGWPLAVEKTRRNSDVFYLIAFLQDVSLLFFGLVEERRPVSSDYLRSEPMQKARLLLIQAIKTILDQGSDILGLQSTEEFNP